MSKLQSHFNTDSYWNNWTNSILLKAQKKLKEKLIKLHEGSQGSKYLDLKCMILKLINMKKIWNLEVTSRRFKNNPRKIHTRVRISWFDNK